MNKIQKHVQKKKIKNSKIIEQRISIHYYLVKTLKYQTVFFIEPMYNRSSTILKCGPDFIVLKYS